ncbi:MAG: ISKra4 family transposase [Blastocatellia bacterium]|nr:ISKra4 family transposase [Blastocatellia bacterium]
MPHAHAAASVFSPLDEELGLLPGELTPRLQQSVVRMGTWMPFESAAGELEYLLGVELSESRVRRLTEKAGAALVAVQEAEVERLEGEAPEAPPGPALQLLSVDGAMVPLVGKEWTEVKTLAIGEVTSKVDKRSGEQVIKTSELSYFSRCLESDEFARQALVETHRRGLERAQRVCAVCDGAEWEQKFIDYHREDAVRILDFPHASGYVADTGRIVYGEGSAEFSRWFDTQRHQLRHGEEEEVLSELRSLAKQEPASQELIEEKLNYLTKRREMIRYEEFVKAGYPIGSGSVESANKVVIQARMKQAGMHWARENVNPMAALRNVACNDRWEEAWPQIARQLQQERMIQRLQKHPQPMPTLPEVMADEIKRKAIPLPEATPMKETSGKDQKPRQKGSRPAPDHPWRKFSFGKGRFRDFTKGRSAKS